MRKKVVPLAKLAEEHYRRTRRPLRVAVDEAFWCFKRLSRGKVEAIRKQSQRQSYPVEKTIFHNICYLLTLNIELLVVFDGPNAPPKANRPARFVNGDDRALLKEVLRALDVPYIDALHEAEADCCQLQTLGRVDAVWSDDSDCLMFGCEMWLRTHRVALEDEGETQNMANGKQKKAKTLKVKEEICVVYAKYMQEKHGLTREDYVLYAMLAGADYDRHGLLGCGHDRALAATQSEHKLGISLCQAKNQQDCAAWRKGQLVPYLEAQNPRITVPDNFPQYRFLKLYNTPLVYPEDSDELLDAKMQRNYKRTINENKLFELTFTKFNKPGALYIDRVAPILHTQFPRDRDAGLPYETVHGTKLKRPEPETDNTVTKINFSPFGLSELSMSVLQRKKLHAEKRGQKKIDTDYGVDCGVPTYLLQEVLPPELFDTDATRTPAAKRKATDEESTQGEAAPKAKKQRTPQASSYIGNTPTSSAHRRVLESPVQVADPELRLPTT